MNSARFSFVPSCRGTVFIEGALQHQFLTHLHAVLKILGKIPPADHLQFTGRIARNGT